jgi:tRNA splicing ligase
MIADTQERAWMESTAAISPHPSAGRAECRDRGPSLAFYQKNCIWNGTGFRGQVNTQEINQTGLFITQSFGRIDQRGFDRLINYGEDGGGKRHKRGQNKYS